ncbi:hypothetical protein JHK82_033020 [Glycine max]|nr:hypothetical protein JHK82_033020 [Glycine max]
MKQATLFSFSLFLLLSSTTMAISPAPAAAPKTPPTPKATAPSPNHYPNPPPQNHRNHEQHQLTAHNSQECGITILAPDDSAFSNLKAGFLNSLNEGQKIELVQFHILPEFVSSSNFDSLSNPVQTVAGKDPARLPLNVNALGNSVNISTGVVNATILGVVYSDNKLGIYHVDKVLLPLDFFLTNKAPALAPTTLAKAPKAAKENSSDDDQEETDQNHNKSGAVSLVSLGGAMLMSIGIALVTVATMWS